MCLRDFIAALLTRFDFRDTSRRRLTKTTLGTVIIPPEEVYNREISQVWNHINPSAQVRPGDAFTVLAYKAKKPMLFSDWRNLQDSIQATPLGYLGLVAVRMQISTKLIPNVRYTSMNSTSQVGMCGIWCNPVSGLFFDVVTYNNEVLGESDRMLFFVKAKEGK